MSISEDMRRLQSEMTLTPVDFMGRQSPRETITIMIVGDKGSGKSLFMAILGFIYQYAKSYFYSNFWMDERITYRKEFNIKNLFNNPNVSAIFLDEMHNIADQNSNNSLETQLLVSLFTQTRKRGQLVVMSSLKFYKVAKDLRHLVDMIIYPEYNKYYDYLNLVIWNFKQGYIKEQKVQNVSAFFEYYNTYELITSENMKYQLGQYLLKNAKLKKDMEKELDRNDIDLVENLEEKLKE